MTLGRDAADVPVADEDRLAKIDDLADQAVLRRIAVAARNDVLLEQELGVDAQVGPAPDRGRKVRFRASLDRAVRRELEGEGPRRLRRHLRL